MVNIGEITVKRKKPAPDAILISDEEEAESGKGHATISKGKCSIAMPEPRRELHEEVRLIGQEGRIINGFC
ncbi:hypothetical protein BV898_12874 [Hypsibius exemplaris]|uniref:Uncharacterized protein n=1 Tax=Hypsibius exemplaris TaxID=2072580 RepID=A0A1W0WCH4_HYPEX|nr:hypothetical protein BV898_12874 [Hypsibius exemplaris]